MHFKALFSFHFPMHFKSLVFQHFSFIPRLVCAESDYNTLNLQETQSSPKCSLESLYTCSVAISVNNYCHLRVSSCMQVPLRHTQPHLPSLQNEFRMEFACSSPLVLCAKARELPCLQGCPALLFQAQSLFAERAFCSFFGEVGMVVSTQLLWMHLNSLSTKGRESLKSQSWPDWHLCRCSPDFSETSALTSEWRQPGLGAVQQYLCFQKETLPLAWPLPWAEGSCIGLSHLQRTASS